MQGGFDGGFFNLSLSGGGILMLTINLYMGKGSGNLYAL